MTDEVKYPTAWSYSAWAQYKLCPLKYHGAKILKLPEPPSKHLIEGNQFHVEIAAHISMHQNPPPARPIHKAIQPIVEQLRQVDSKVVEQQWAFDTRWAQTGWFAKGTNATWLRVILDVGINYMDGTGLVGDWKTGKRYDENDEQMELFAMAAFVRWPTMNEVETRLWYVDNGHEEVATYNRELLPALKAKWRMRADEMLADRTWTPKPNDKCGWCVRARSAGGDCKFG